MNTTPLLPSPMPDLKAAKHEYLEFYGSTAVLNNTLKTVALCLSVLSVGLIFAEIKTVQQLRNVKPVIIRIDQLGRAETVTGSALEYRPQEPEIKYFLIQFVQNHYGRIRATVRDNYTRSFSFLENRLADSIMETNKKSKTIETFLAGQGDEVEINVKNVSIEDLRTSPYKATVDFEKIYYGSGERTESKREKYSAHFVFVVKERVPNAWIPINPLGLTITYFREDQAFE